MVNTATDETIVDSEDWCEGGPRVLRDLPAGEYRLSVSKRGQSGTYKLDVTFDPPQVFELATLPATISDGIPASGAGKHEADTSEDIYEFTAGTDTLRMSFSSCSNPAGIIDYTLTRISTSSVAAQGVSCGAVTATTVAGAKYRLSVTGLGMAGEYRLDLAEE